jgi:predicted HD phosphohydrolase
MKECSLHQGIAGIVELYRVHGAAQYGGEAVSQLEHALQCAHLAESAGAAPALVAACFLHDVGHMVWHSAAADAAGGMRKGVVHGLLDYLASGESHEYQHTPAEQAALQDKRANDLHEHRAQWFLENLFGPEVLEPIRLHVEAKRYLCHANPGYWDLLSPASKHSLEVQGGPHDADQARSFARMAHAQDAVQLRRWDDCAKAPGAPVPGLDHFALVLQSVMS